MTLLQEVFVETRRLLGRDVDLHDSQWLSFELSGCVDNLSLRVDWALFSGDPNFFVRASVCFLGITSLVMPPRWESVWECQLCRLDTGHVALRMTENHEEIPIQVVCAGIQEVSALLEPIGNLNLLLSDAYAPRGMIRLSEGA